MSRQSVDSTAEENCTFDGRDVVDGSSHRGVVPQIQFSKVSQYFLSATKEPFLAVQDVELSVAPGRFVSIVGPSGCGKSTLLNITAGLLEPTRGEASYGGGRISGVNTDVGYLTQQDHLLPWRTVQGNVGLPLEIQRVGARERRERVDRILHLVGLSDFASHYPPQLSGGMRKRTALARVLIYEPATLLMDEPFAALDAQLRTVMQRELLSLWERDEKTVLFVTHDLEEAILLADEVVVFGSNPGRIIHIEQVSIPRPRNLVSIRNEPSFVEVWSRLWSLIEGELDAASEERADV